MFIGPKPLERYLELSIVNKILAEALTYGVAWHMPKYYSFKIAGYFLCFTSKCIIEAFHTHASDGTLAQRGSEKIFVRRDGLSTVMELTSITHV